MHMECLDCNYGCGTPHTLLFHYKIEHKNKVRKCACGNQTKRGTASKGSSSSFSPSSSSIFSSSSNPNSDSNLRSRFTDSNSSSNSNSIPSTIPDPNPKNLRRSFTDSHIETKFDITNKICNRCRVIKQITCFDKKEVNM